MCLLRTSLVLLMGICFVTNASAQKNTAPDPPNSPLATNQSEGLKFFAETIRPVFEQNCVECHGGKATRSGFNLLTQAGLLKGGDNGEAIVPRDPESSRMLKLLRHTEDPGMPYKKPALDDAIISTIARWIALGAPYAGPLQAVKRGEKLSESFWAVKPLVE